ncbi:MAG: helix-turn-helix domain-containing protein [Firmicutes bacterium]|nr:helix-turn-helix domain-containing protein [Bacillota bacterium]
MAEEMTEREGRRDSHDELNAIGDLLKETRLKQGITLEEVQEETKIRRYYLEALESGSVEAIPGEVYVRGFLRNYAQFLGLPAEELVARYTGTKPIAAESKVTEWQRRPPAHKRHLAATPRGTTRGLATTVVLIAVLLVVAYLLLVGTPVQPPGQAADEPPVNEEPAPPHTDPGPDTLSPGSVVYPVVEVVLLRDLPREALYEVRGVSGIEVTLTTTGERCWLAVRLDGGPEESETMTRGTTRSLTAKRSLWLRAGDPGAIELVVNGVSLGRAGKPGVPRNITIEKAD